MKIKTILSSVCLILIAFLCVGCSEGLKVDNFMSAYNSLNEAITINKTVSYTVGNETLYNQKIISRSSIDGKVVVSFYEYDKRFNEISIDNTSKYKITTSQKYYYDNQIGEVVSDEIVWRAGLLEELTNEWGSSTVATFDQNYLSDIVIDEEAKTLTANIKQEYYDDIIQEEVTDLTLSIQIDNDNRLKLITYSYVCDNINFNITFDVSFEAVEIDIE